MLESVLKNEISETKGKHHRWTELQAEDNGGDVKAGELLSINFWAVWSYKKLLPYIFYIF